VQRDETQQMLAFIEQMTARSFPDGAADAWWTMLGSVDFRDGMRAAREWFDQPEPPKQTIHPGYVKRRAHEIAEVRSRRERQAIERAPAGVPPNGEWFAAREALARKLGDLDRQRTSVAA